MTGLLEKFITTQCLFYNEFKEIVPELSLNGNYMEGKKNLYFHYLNFCKKEGMVPVGCYYFWKIIEKEYFSSSPELVKHSKTIKKTHPLDSTRKTRAGNCYWFLVSKLCLSTFMNQLNYFNNVNKAPTVTPNAAHSGELDSVSITIIESEITVESTPSSESKPVENKEDNILPKSALIVPGVRCQSVAKKVSFAGETRDGLSCPERIKERKRSVPVDIHNRRAGPITRNRVLVPRNKTAKPNTRLQQVSRIYIKAQKTFVSEHRPTKNILPDLSNIIPKKPMIQLKHKNANSGVKKEDMLAKSVSITAGPQATSISENTNSNPNVSIITNANSDSNPDKNLVYESDTTSTVDSNNYLTENSDSDQNLEPNVNTTKKSKPSSNNPNKSLTGEKQKPMSRYKRNMEERRKRGQVVSVAQQSTVADQQSILLEMSHLAKRVINVADLGPGKPVILDLPKVNSTTDFYCRGRRYRKTNQCEEIVNGLPTSDLNEEEIQFNLSEPGVTSTKQTLARDLALGPDTDMTVGKDSTVLPDDETEEEEEGEIIEEHSKEDTKDDDK